MLSGCLNLANAWIPYGTCSAEIFNKPQKRGGGAGPTPKSALEYWPLDLHVCAIVQGRNVLYHQETTRRWDFWFFFCIKVFANHNTMHLPNFACLRLL